MRRRLIVLLAGTVAICLLIATVSGYALVADGMRREVDNSLHRRVDRIANLVRGGNLELTRQLLRPESVQTETGFVRVLNAAGGIVVDELPSSGVPLSDTDRAIASGAQEESARTVHVDDKPVRVLTVPIGVGGAIQAARSEDEMHHSLEALRMRMAALLLGAMALTSLLAWKLASVILVPIRRLQDAMDDVRHTRDLRTVLDLPRDDELGRLADSFDRLLAALADADVAKDRFLADASHELRTPITSLRGNLDLLRDNIDRIDPDDRAEMLTAASEQAAELSVLVNDLMAVIRDSETEQRADLQLDDLVNEIFTAARRQFPDVIFTHTANGGRVHASAALLRRAVRNLVDNAAQYSPEGGTVHVATDGGTVRVSDQGPGIANEDVDRVFERFWRADDRRRMSGSGLGLAIVDAVAQSHGGSASVAATGPDGTTMQLSLPTV